MKERGRNIAVGVTALAGLVGVCFLMALFGYLPGWSESGYRVEAVFDHTGGLNAGSRVKLRGIDVGQVTGVMLLGVTEGVKVTARVDEHLALPAGTRARIDAPLIGGTPALVLDVSQVHTEDMGHALDLTKPIPGYADPGFAGQIEQLMNEPMQRLDRLTASFESLSSEWKTVGQNVNQLTAPRRAAEVDGGGVPGNLASVLDRMDRVVRETQSVVEGVNAWVNDAKLRDDARVAVANTRDITEHVKAGVDRVTSLTDSVRENMDGLTRRYKAVADDLSREIANTGKLIEQARAGEGTVGKLLQDPALYNNLNGTVQRMDKAIVDLRLLLQKWKSDGMPVNFGG